MKITIHSIKKANIKQYFILLILLCISQIAFGDDVQKSIDTNYLRTPEASAFKKYGEESVNEYTGTADISVPLYTIKCKDIEIPLVLRYDASGIKVEQEASWVGLGWNLMVGGCINYVCAGTHDMYSETQIPSKTWTEYLTSEFSRWSSEDSIKEVKLSGSVLEHSKVNQAHDEWASRTRILYYTYSDNDKFNWMAKLPYHSQTFIDSYTDVFFADGMKEYIDKGYGERDFYSVNVMGKSFIFFVDPATLQVFQIGKAGEEFKVEPIYEGDCTKGIGKQSDIKKWTITDSDGYVYEFNVRDKYKMDSRNSNSYTSCWYLTKIQSPTVGVYAEFEYETFSKYGRTTNVESYNLPFVHDLGAFCCGDAASQIKLSSGSTFQSGNDGMKVTNHYLKQIKTNNQTVTFITSPSDECSGKKIEQIEVQSYEGKPIKTVKFNYGLFSSSTIGGNYAPKDPSISSHDRLKLESVSDCNTESEDVLTTSFSYNESIKLPSKRSCAQDYWGYYNGRENKVGSSHTLIPTPQSFMSSFYNDILDKYPNIGGADRYSRADCMQAAILNKVIYPTGGFTIYEYEPNSIITRDFTQTEKYRDKQYDVKVQASYSCSPTPYGPKESGERRKEFIIDSDVKCDLILRSSGDSKIYNKDLQIEIRKWNDTKKTYDLIKEYKEKFQLHVDFDPIIKDLNLSAGKYYIGITVNNSEKLSMGLTYSLNGWEKSQVENSGYPLAVGGLRVKKISNYDNDGKKINYTTYEYSNGILLDKIETIDYDTKFNGSPKSDSYSIGNITHSINVYTITPGHPRMPAFFASCNPGIVGYSCVTKNKYNVNDDLEKSIVTSYRNNEPMNMYGIDYYENFGNGLVNWQQIYDASDSIAVKTENLHVIDRVEHYATNLIAKNKYCGSYGNSYASVPYYEYQERHGDGNTITKENVTLYALPGAYDVMRYPYILSRTDLTKTITTEYGSGRKTIVNAKEYTYNPKNHQVSQTDEYRSGNVRNAQNGVSLTNLIHRKKIKYTVDEMDNDLNCSTMVRSHHRLNDVLETKEILVENGTESCMNTIRIAYNNAGFPISSSTSIGANQPEVRSIYTYDGDSNVRSISLDGKETIYIWSYNGQYPIAKIEGITYKEVEDAVGKTNISSLLRKTTPTTSDINTIRTNIKAKGGYVTTYTYKPLVGMTSQTLPNGLTTKYEYDGFGRLVKIIDHNGKTVATNSYHYKK